MADGSSGHATAAESSSSGLSDDHLPFVAGPDGEEQPEELPEGTMECSICLQGCIHPVRLPCSHIFCFLCVKGVANHSKRCALCRSEIPPDFILRPILLNADDVLRPTQAFDGKYQWFYEGVRGWWQYDVRASTEIEDRYQKGERIFEMLIAGFLYIVDMENMVQYRRNTPARRRRIKRDLVDIPDKKGVAGLSCKVRPPRRTGGDGGERRDTGGGGVPAATNNNNSSSSTQVSSVQQQMRDMSLGNGGTDNGVGPQGNHRSARVAGRRAAAADGVDRAVNSSAADTGPVPQTNAGLRSSRVNRHDASVSSQPSDGTSRVNSFGSRPNRRDTDGLEAPPSVQPSTSAAMNSRVSLAGPDAAANVQPSTSARNSSRVSAGSDHITADRQPLSLNIGGTSPSVSTPANVQPKQGNRGISQPTNCTTDNQLVSSAGINLVDNVADGASQPVVQNCVDTQARNEPARRDQFGQASLPDRQSATLDQRRIEGKAEMDRADHVDGSSDSE